MRREEHYRLPSWPCLTLRSSHFQGLTLSVFTFRGQNAQRNAPKEEVFGSTVSGGFSPWLWERHGEVVAGGTGNSDSHHNGQESQEAESVRREGAPDPATPSGRTVSSSLSKQTTVPELGLVFLFPQPFSDRKINLFYFVE